MVKGWPFGDPLDQHATPVMISPGWVYQTYETPYMCPVSVPDDPAAPGFYTPNGWYYQFGSSVDWGAINLAHKPFLMVRRSRWNLHEWNKSYPGTGGPPLFYTDLGNSQLSFAWHYQPGDTRISVVTVGPVQTHEATGGPVGTPTNPYLTGNLQFSQLTISGGLYGFTSPTASSERVSMQINAVQNCDGQLFLKRIPGGTDYIIYHNGLAAPYNAANYYAYNGSGLQYSIFSSGAWAAPVDVFPTAPNIDYQMIGCEWDGSSVLHFFGLKVDWTTIVGSSGESYSIVHRTWTSSGGLGAIEEIVPPPNKTSWNALVSTYKIVKWPVWDGTKMILPYHYNDSSMPFGQQMDLGFMTGTTGSWTFDTSSLKAAILSTSLTDYAGHPVKLGRSDPWEVFNATTYNGDLFAVVGLDPMDASSGNSSYWYRGSFLFWTRKDHTTGVWDPLRRLMYIQEGTTLDSTYCFWGFLGGYSTTANDQGYDDPHSKFVFSFIWGPADQSYGIDIPYDASSHTDVVSNHPSLACIATYYNAPPASTGTPPGNGGGGPPPGTCQNPIVVPITTTRTSAEVVTYQFA